MGRAILRGAAAVLILGLAARESGSVISVEPTLSFHENAGASGGPTYGAFRLGSRIPLAVGEFPESAGIRVGRLTLDIPLEAGRGRVHLREEFRSLRARAVVRGGFLDLRVRGRLHVYPEGIVPGSLYACSNGPVFDLLEAQVLAGTREIPFVVGVSGWNQVLAPSICGQSLRAVGIGIPEGGTGLYLRMAMPGPGSRWLGRVAGQALAVGGEPLVESALDGGDRRAVEGLKVREAFAGATRVVQVTFDTAVPAPAGPRVLEVRALRGGRSERAVVAFEAPETRPPLAVSIGFFHSLEIREEGKVWSYGAPYHGALGLRTHGVPLCPMTVDGAVRARSVAAGTFFSVAADVLGDAWFWGNMDGGPGPNYLPTRWGFDAPVRAVAAGEMNAYYLLEDGKVRACGANVWGGIGDGTMEDRRRPVPVPGLDGVKAIAAGDFGCLALQGDGTVWQWGGTFGAGSVPVRVPGLPPCVAFDIDGPAIALDREGGVWTWELDENYEAPFAERVHPVRVSGLPAARAVAAGEDWFLAADGEGRVWAWGANTFGTLGDGTQDERLTPARVPGLEGVATVRARGYQSLAVLADGAVWTWGITSWEFWSIPGDDDTDSLPILDRREGEFGFEPLPTASFLREAQGSSRASSDGSGTGQESRRRVRANRR